MAADCSRLWKLTDSQLLDHCNTTYPQETSWKLVYLRSDMRSALTLALLRQRLLPQSFLGNLVPKMVTGELGRTSLPILKESTRTSLSSLNQSSYIFSKFLQPNYNEESLLPVATLSDLVKWKTTFRPLEWRLLMWTTKTHASCHPGTYTAR